MHLDFFFPPAFYHHKHYCDCEKQNFLDKFLLSIMFFLLHRRRHSDPQRVMLVQTEHERLYKIFIKKEPV